MAAYGEAQPQTGAKQDRPRLFERKDTNHDGKLTWIEFIAGQPDPAQAPARFSRFDANKDGELSREEFVSEGQPAPPPADKTNPK